MLPVDEKMLEEHKHEDHFKCPMCAKATLKTQHFFLGGPYSGFVSCSACGYQDTMISHLGRKILSVEPIDPGTPMWYATHTPWWKRIWNLFSKHGYKSILRK